LALLAASILSFFLLDRSLRNSESSLKNLEETLTREKTPKEATLERDILSLQKKIKNFSQLFSRHSYPSKAFDFVESVTHPEVWISQVSLDARESKVVASGETESFTTLGQQLLILEKNPQIKSFLLSSLSIGKKGRVDFTLNISLDPKIFK
ncbi:MAG: hypothetical protein Q7S70_01195, partial [bacterium]|nr:hypothetical protein [bacterium]